MRDSETRQRFEYLTDSIVAQFGWRAFAWACWRWLDDKGKAGVADYFGRKKQGA